MNTHRTAQDKSDAIEAQKGNEVVTNIAPTASQIDGHKFETIKAHVNKKMREYEPEMRLERFCD